MSTIQPTPTPETDARFNRAGMSKSSLADFARNLERERDEARETVASLAHALPSPPPTTNQSPFHALQNLQEIQREGWLEETP